MWNRQREAEEAREKLAQTGEIDSPEDAAPHLGDTLATPDAAE